MSDDLTTEQLLEILESERLNIEALLDPRPIPFLDYEPIPKARRTRRKAR